MNIYIMAILLGITIGILTAIPASVVLQALVVLWSKR
jgi:hypothetical protein